MICAVCGKQVPQEYVFCLDCLHDIKEAVKQKRNQVINDAMEKVSKEADEVYEKDPAKGRGRGPRWMDG
jgi:uncharacterized membrane protein YvbJ